MKVVCLSILLLLCYFSYSQTKENFNSKTSVPVGQCMDGTVLHTRLEYSVTKEDTLFTLLVRNEQHPDAADYQGIRFSGGNHAVNQLYDIIKSVFTDKKRMQRNYSITITLGKKLVVIGTTKILRSVCAVVYLPTGYCYLTERQVDQVFGKI